MKNKNKKYCSKCEELKKRDDDFYLACNDIVSSDHRLTICKECLIEIVDYKNTESFIQILRMIDRPFLKSEYDRCLTYDNPFGEYMKALGMRQNRLKSYEDSQFENLREPVKTANELNKREQFDASNIKITQDMIVKWGDGYSNFELQQLEQFYREMIDANDIRTPQHRSQLILFCKVNLEQNKALSEGRTGDFKNLNMQFNKILADSGFRPIDSKSGGESAGIRTFSQIWEEIERDGFIKPAPIKENQDIVDNTVMYIENNTRKLLNINVLSKPPTDTPKVDKE